MRGPVNRHYVAMISCSRPLERKKKKGQDVALQHARYMVLTNQALAVETNSLEL